MAAAGVALAGALAVVGGLAFASAFAVGDLVRPVVVGAVGGVGGPVLVGGVLRRRVVLTALGTLALLAPLALLATGGGPSDLVTGASDGARLVLTSAVPMAPTPPALVVPFAVTAMAAFAGVEAARRAGNAVAPVLPSLVALAVGLAFGLEGSRPPGWVVGAWLAGAAVLVASRRGAPADSLDDDARPTPTGGHAAPRHATTAGRGAGRAAPAAALRRAAAVALVVALVSVAAPRLGERLPGAASRDRFTLRDLVEQPARPEAAANPLVLVTAWQDGPDEPLFTAEASGPVERWRLAVLDTYDGVEWASGAPFVPVGRRLPDPPDGSGDGDTVTQTVGDLAVEGPWLPVADRPVEVGADDLLFDVGGGVLLAGDGQSPRSYTVESVPARPEAGDLRSARAAGDHEADGMRTLPDNVPDDLRAAAGEVTAGSTSDYMKAAAIERYLARSDEATPFQLATEALPSGHSVGHLRCFLLEPERCGRRGSTEQFVAAFAVLARAAGLPTRIVVGFTASRAGGGAGAAAAVTSHQATAWPEVRLAGAGWVPFDPLPSPDVTTVTLPADVAGGGGAPDSSTATTLAGTDDDAGDAGAADPAEQAPSDDGRPLVAYAGAVLLVVVVLAAPAAVRHRRRRRRRRGPDAGHRVVGAWAEAADGLAASGVPVVAGGTVTDAVRAGQARLPEIAGPLVPLGDLVNRSRFGPGLVTDADAEAAWRLSDAFTSARRRGRTAGQRAREYVALRAPARERA